MSLPTSGRGFRNGRGRLANSPEKRRRGRPQGAATNGSEALLRAALGAFAEHGFQGATIRAIAAQAGVDPALIAHHFGSKLGLWRAAVDLIADSIATGLETAPRLEDMAAEDALALLLGHCIDIVCDMPEIAVFAHREIMGRGERFDYFYARVIRPLRDLVVPRVEDAIEAGQLPDLDPDFVYLTATGAFAATVVARGFLANTSPAARDDARFRAELKRVILFNVTNRPGPQPAVESRREGGQ